MTIQRMEHVGIVVEDLAAAIDFFAQLGLELRGEASVEADWVDRVVGLDGVRLDIAMMQAKDGNGRLELTRFRSPADDGDHRPAPPNRPGIRHITFAVQDIDAAVAGLRARGSALIGELVDNANGYRICYVRGPEGILVELAEKTGT